MYHEDNLLKKLLKDKKLALILFSISKSFKTAEQIGNDCNISITTVYRKLKILEENHYLEKSGKLTNDGRVRYFRKKPRIDILESITAQE
jgi:response regulator of citrate/malate metabolism